MADFNNLGIQVTCVLQDSEKVRANLQGALDKIKLNAKINSIEFDKSAISEIETKLKNLQNLFNSGFKGGGIPLNDFKNSIQELQNIQMNGIPTTLFKTNKGEFVQSAELMNKQAKEAEKLANAMGKIRENSEIKNKSADRKSELEQAKAINKSLEEQYSNEQKVTKEAEKFNHELYISNDMIEAMKLKMNNKLDKLFANNIVPKDELLKMEESISGLNAGSSMTEMQKVDTSLSNIIEKEKQISKEKQNRLKIQQESINNALKEQSEQEKMNILSSEFSQKMNIAIDNLHAKYHNAVPMEQVDVFRAKLEQIKNLNIGGKPIESLNGLKRAIEETRLEYAKLDSITRQNASGFLGTLQHNLSGFLQFYLGAGGIIGVISAIRSGIQDIAEMDNALVDLNKVVDMSSQQMLEMRDSAIEMGKALGQSASDIVAGMAEFGRVTKNLSEIQELTRVDVVAPLYSNI